MRYIPNTPAVRERMLAEIGLGSVEELFAAIPPALRLDRPLDLPPALSEPGLLEELGAIGRANAGPETHACFLGAGCYRHFVPAVVPALASRGEFLTAYTPYQPEASQGTLQAMYEFQSFVCLLTGLDVANASLYDGASAAAEAVLMARRITGRGRVFVAESLHPEYRATIATYCRPLGAAAVAVPWEPGTGRLDEAALDLAGGAPPAALVVQSPNFFGVIEELPALAEWAHRTDTLLIAVHTEPFSLGLLRSPGELGADIAAGEWQGFGNPPHFGGPGLGILATRREHLRQMPGRIAGATVDGAGRRGFVLTLAAREQHIRRERATSNICSNESHCALAATIFLAALGRAGLAEAARQNWSKAHVLRERILALPGWRPLFSGEFFNEFALAGPAPPARLARRLARAGVLGGLDLGRWHRGLAGGVLLCATENNTRGEMDRLLAALAGSR